MRYVVSGKLDTWHDPHRPVFLYQHGADPKLKPRKIARTSTIRVKCQTTSTAWHMKTVFKHLFNDVVVERL